MLHIGLQFFAHKKGVGSTRNGRDSMAQRLGVKRGDGQFVLAGNIPQAGLHRGGCRGVIFPCIPSPERTAVRGFFPIGPVPKEVPYGKYIH